MLIGVLAACQEAPTRAPWPSFRGAGASGIADGEQPPVRWDLETGDNVLWRTPIPGLGHSSPVVWGDRVFVTTAVSDNPDSIFRAGLDERIDRRTDRSRHVWRVYALDRDTGEVAWMHEPLVTEPSVQRHPKNSYATATPATDGEHVVVMVATGDLYGYDFDGDLRWQVDLGPLLATSSYDVTYQFGAASSPIIWQDLVIVQADQHEGSFLAAFDIGTGEEVWRTERDLISSFSTPTIHEGANRVELVTNGAESMRGYDPRTGEELWRLSSHPGGRAPAPTGDLWTWATVATPVSADGLIFVSTVYRRDHPLFAVREGAIGDISLASRETSNAHVAWRLRRGGPWLTTPLVYRGLLYIVSPIGILTAFDTGTGERVYRGRILDTGGAYSASPVAADGRLYVTSEDGDVAVVEVGVDVGVEAGVEAAPESRVAGREVEVLAVNRMDGVCLATPAISDGQLFIRTTGHLYALQNGASRPPD